ncbi:MAG: YqhA family protein [Candidatus Accumulibacter necessarius]|uniref:YqhA family protein n=1 Tax=Candidatus Accumulibacter necessarius TaxID=2954386 RepID=UPI002FC3A396
MRPLLNASRFLVLAAVLGSLLSAMALYAYGLVDTVVVITRTLTAGDVSTRGAKALMLYFIEIFDLFLLGTVMLILALGLYELFIDADFKVASRLQINTFEDLKTSLVTVVIAVMAVTFLGQIMSWNGETSLFDIGVPVALVIAALNIYLWVAKAAKK